VFKYKRRFCITNLQRVPDQEPRYYLINFSLSLYLKKNVNLDYGKAFRKNVAKH